MLGLASIFIFCTGAASCQVPDEALEASIALESPESAVGESALLHFELTNNSKSTLHVLTWATPLEGVLGNIFKVTQDGERVTYRGILMRRGDPSASEYITLKPGEAASATVDLAESYDLDRGGEYQVALDTKLHDVSAEPGPRDVDEHEGYELTTGPITLSRGPGEPRVSDVAAAPDPPPTPTNCTGTQKDFALSANEAATSVSKTATAYLENCGSADPQGVYATWFGAQTPQRLSLTETDMAAIRMTLDGDKGTLPFYSCGSSSCKPSTFAFVSPSDTTHKVNLCPLFFASAVPDSERVVTVVHEISHFSDVAGTNAPPYAKEIYGISASQKLAETNPEYAVHNAENYGYFANTDVLCANVELRSACSGTSPVIQTVTSTGCKNVTAGGVSWVDVGRGYEVTLYKGSDCSGQELTVDAPIAAQNVNLCSAPGSYNDKLASIRVGKSSSSRIANLRSDCSGTSPIIQSIDATGCQNVAGGGVSRVDVGRGYFLTLYTATDCPASAAALRIDGLAEAQSANLCNGDLNDKVKSVCSSATGLTCPKP